MNYYGLSGLLFPFSLVLTDGLPLPQRVRERFIEARTTARKVCKIVDQLKKIMIIPEIFSCPMFIAELWRTRSKGSGAPRVRKKGNLWIREILVTT